MPFAYIEGIINKGGVISKDVPIAYMVEPEGKTALVISLDRQSGVPTKELNNGDKGYKTLDFALYLKLSVEDFSFDFGTYILSEIYNNIAMSRYKNISGKVITELTPFTFSPLGVLEGSYIFSMPITLTLKSGGN